MYLEGQQLRGYFNSNGFSVILESSLDMAEVKSM